MAEIFTVYTQHFHATARKCYLLNPTIEESDDPLRKTGACSWEYENNFYLFGGCFDVPPYELNAIKPSDSLWRYDIKENLWSELQPAPFNGRLSASSAIDRENGIAYISFGTRYASDHMCNDILTYNLKTNTWGKLEINVRKFKRYGHTSAFYNGCLYIYKGTMGTTFKDDLLCVDIKTNKVSIQFPRPGQLSYPCYKHSMTHYMDSTYLIYGGYGGYGNKGVNCCPMYLLDVKTNARRYLMNAGNNRTAHTTVSVKPGIFWIIGGFDKSDEIIYSNKFIEKITITKDADVTVVQSEQVPLLVDRLNDAFFHCSEIINGGILFHGGRMNVNTGERSDRTYYIPLA